MTSFLLDNFLLKVGKLKLSRFSEIKEEFSWQENNEKIKTESLGSPWGARNVFVSQVKLQ